MVPFRDAVAQWLMDLEGGGLSRQSITTYAYHLKGLTEYTRDSWPGGEDLRRWQHSIREQSLTTRHNKTTTVRQFFSWAFEERLIGSNPARRLPVPRRPKHLPRMLADEDWHVLESGALLTKLRRQYRKGERHLADRDLAVAQTIMYTGLRLAEVCALSVGDVDTRHRIISVRGKGSRDRKLPYPEKLRLGPWLKDKSPEQPVFGARRGGSRLSEDAISMVFRRKLTPALGKRLHAHLLRHAYATWLCRREPNTRKIQLLLGHASLNTTQVYLDLTVADLRDTVNLFDR